MDAIDRRTFLAGAAALGGGVLLGGRAATAAARPLAVGDSRPPLASEPGTLAILEWPGFEASGTKAQTYGMLAGKEYTTAFGAKGLTYTPILTDTQALDKARSGAAFDLMHPGVENMRDYVDAGLVQPWDTSLLPSFKNLDPALTRRGRLNGKQYLIPWDWGFGSILYRTDKVGAADAKGWELLWNARYRSRIALWDDAQSNFDVAGLYLGLPRIDAQTPGQVTRSKNALLRQKPLTRLYWKSEYHDMQPAFRAGQVWIAYGWQDSYVNMRNAGLKVEFMEPRQGKLAWVRGFMLGAQTKSYYHAHRYVESFIDHAAAVQMVNLFYYGNADATIKSSEIKDKSLAKVLDVGNRHTFTSPDVHIQSWEQNADEIQLAWRDVHPG